MPLKRSHQGVEGYFYQCGNRKLTPQEATIQRVSFGGLGDFVNSAFLDVSQFGLHLDLNKDNGVCATFSVYDTKDIALIFRELGVSMLSQINTLPLKKRRVLAYTHDGINYGIGFPKK